MEPIRTSFAIEAVLGGLLAHWHPRWKPQLALATDPHRPWFPVVFGMNGPGSSTTRLTHWARMTTADKVATDALLREVGIPVPEGRLFAPDKEASAWDYACSVQGPVIVKPFNGAGGRGVSVGVDSRSRFDVALDRLVAHGFGDSPFLVQREVSGWDARVTATRRRAISVLQRVPASVIGDGHSSVRKLTEQRNARHARRLPDWQAPSETLDGEAFSLLAD